MTELTVRNARLKRRLIEHRRNMLDSVRSRIRDGRTDRSVDVRDSLELSDADTQKDIELGLLQMRAETLTRVDQALARLATGTYGTCVECERAISERRLRALPFALRCQACQESREQAQERARSRSIISPFAGMVGS